MIDVFVDEVKPPFSCIWMFMLRRCCSFKCTELAINILFLDPGIDWEEPLSNGITTDTVEVPDTPDFFLFNNGVN